MSNTDTPTLYTQDTPLNLYFSGRESSESTAKAFSVAFCVLFSSLGLFYVFGISRYVDNVVRLRQLYRLPPTPLESSQKILVQGGFYVLKKANNLLARHTQR